MSIWCVAIICTNFQITKNDNKMNKLKIKTTPAMHNLQERNQMLEAKILDWYAKNKDEKFAEHFGIKEAREGRV